MTTSEDLWLHVIGDAKELLITSGLFMPLVTHFSRDLDEISARRRDTVLFLRGHLGRHIVLIVTRLHASRPKRETTGVTASIETVLEYAREESRISQSAAGDFKSRLSQLRTNADLDGANWQDFTTFRNAELAHSLHRSSVDPDSTLLSSNVLELAYNTYELVLDLEKAIGRHPPSLSSWYHTALNRGATFWDGL